MKTTCLLLLQLALCAWALNAPNPHPRVRTSCGWVEGRWEHYGNRKVAAFRGIPFAKFTQRWTPPQFADCWTGILQAVNNGPACFQYGTTYEIPPEQQSENCLSLNVLVPQPLEGDNDDDNEFEQDERDNDDDNDNKLATLATFHGGSNMGGDKKTPGGDINESVFQFRGTNVIRVAINYPVAIFGSLTLEELCAERATDGLPCGNWHLQTQQVGLRWIQREIEAFGGSRLRVTIFGHSSGGTDVQALLASPGSRGLFQAAIALSLSPNVSMSLQQAQQQHRDRIIAFTSCGNLTGPVLLTCLRALPAADLIAAMDNSVTGSSLAFNYGGYPLFPSGTLEDPQQSGVVYVDGRVITHPIREALRIGVVPDVAYFSGAQAQEIGFFPGFPIFDVDTLRNMPRAEIDDWLRTFFAFAIGGGEPLVQAYASIPTAYEVYETLFADLSMKCGTIELARTAGSGGLSNRPVYVKISEYWFSAPLPTVTGNITDAAHAVDMMAMSGEGVFPFPAFIDESTVVPHTYSTLDKRFGRLFRQEVFTFGKRHRLPRRWARRVAAAGESGDNDPYSVIVHTRNAERTNVANYMRNRCNVLRNAGLIPLSYLVNRR